MTEMNGVDLNVESYILKPSPRKVKEEVPRSDEARTTVLNGRSMIEEILMKKDSKLLVIAGQCSTHDVAEDMEVSRRLYDISRDVSDKIVTVKRTYFEKPRTGLGWEGLMIDPHLDASYDVREGLKLCRRVLLFANELGLPCATEYVESQSPQYNSDLITWAAIGARTANSPTHRKLASLLSMPVGIKNETHGDIDVAINGILKAMQPNILPDGITEDGEPAIVKSKGNPYAHLVLRGGQQGPNYSEEHVSKALALLKKYEDLSSVIRYEHLKIHGINGMLQSVLIDCSHDNVLELDESSIPPKWRKNSNSYERQAIVFQDGIRQRIDNGNKGIVGFMVETNIVGGKQPLPTDLRGFDKSKLKYGISVTDACLPLSDFKRLVVEAYKML